MQQNPLHVLHQAFSKGKNEALTIDQLRQENSFLKTQLQKFANGSLIKKSPSVPQLSNVQKVFYSQQNSQIFVKPDNVEENYRSKMKKIKSKNSSKKSTQRHPSSSKANPFKQIHNLSKTNQNSSLKTYKSSQIRLKNHQKESLVPIDNRIKMMVIDQDTSGKYYRDIDTQRKYRNSFENSREKGFLKICSKNNRDIIHKKTEIHKPVNFMHTHKQNLHHQENKKITKMENLDKLLNVRGNVYVQMSEKRKNPKLHIFAEEAVSEIQMRQEIPYYRQNNQKTLRMNLQTRKNKQPQSILSIEEQLIENNFKKESKRKMKCNVYLEEQDL